ncbi:hypothetical protein AMS68_003266 [Peltaster fructicola]|uniref:Ribosome maturation protein SDO1/SBDS N-terminal domain-containing protein n=1 Tax=Peltaster fructicola TaxID=286661 RepID=A0A6H0XT05_9PEZI|nr:hypothetical protein AMS68_003266 [Peltaster fructicola]
MRGDHAITKVHYHGNDDDFIVYADSAQAVQDWKKDSSIPLAQVVSGFKIFVSHKHGNQGVHDGASKSQLEGEFGTSNEDEVIKKILESGSIIAGENSARGGDRNISQGGSVAH